MNNTFQNCSITVRHIQKIDSLLYSRIGINKTFHLTFRLHNYDTSIKNGWLIRHASFKKNQLLKKSVINALACLAPLVNTCKTLDRRGRTETNVLLANLC